MCPRCLVSYVFFSLSAALSSFCCPRSLLASCVFCLCCVMPPHSTSSQDLLYSCCIVLLQSVCVERQEAVRENMFCVCVCASVLQSSVAMAAPGTSLRQLCGPALPESCCRKALSLSSGEIHTHKHLSPYESETDRVCLTGAWGIVVPSLPCIAVCPPSSHTGHLQMRHLWY